MKYSILLANSFKKEAKKLNKEDIKLTMQIIDRLANDEILEEKYKDHKLKGKYTGCKECHIKPNLLLIYKKAYLCLQPYASALTASFFK
ncbi:putative addiction module toxin [Helicobacter fennelliae]|uniref:YafQ toxin protein n=2 Tax=Helicobacter fennelliae TaxID=215 RepID=T1D1M7_9HELI|nr:type II toxin-antitoxin system YafQ family toxin [Helicobacter fennelliae]GAD20125.1 hypothetical protein HFN_1369 [Helicobacter fennelliae MRY12-0050]SQB98769.1 putative addiction module toxin [Helicobacter fennelliae]STP08111.1 putative addiction module toxin [Helicobacter fennelliae]